MFSPKEMEELQNASDETLRAVIAVMKYQIAAMLFIGDKDRSVAMSNAAKHILDKRA